MALTFSGPILHGFSAYTGGTATYPDYQVSWPGKGINDVFYVGSNDYSTHAVEINNPYIELSNGVLYDPFQTYDAPKVDKPESYQMTFVGSGSSSSFNFASNGAADIEADIMQKKLYIFYLFPTSGFLYYSIWRARGRLLRISYQDVQNFAGRVSAIEYTVIKESSTYQNIGTTTS